MEYEHPSTYDALRKAEQLRKTQIIKDHLGEGKTLDVGCGTGISSSLFPDVLGVDPSVSLLEKNPYPCQQGHSEDLPFSDDSFENIIAVTSIHNFADIEKGLLEMKRVGKHFGFSVLKRSKHFAFIEEQINEHFVVEERIDEGIDVIFICK